MFELANPWVLLLIILPILIWYTLPSLSLKAGAALKVPFYKPLQAIVRHSKNAFTWGVPALFFLIWVLLVLALAGPRWIGNPIPLKREGRNIMLVLDLSGSMEINDMLLEGRPTSRLNVVKRAAKKFVQARAEDKIGLILFGSQAYLQTPLTYDHHNVILRIDDATAGLAGKTTSLGDALGLAVKRLQNVPSKGRVVILLTDGVNNSGVLAPLKAAELARDDQIKVYTIGLGSEAATSFAQALYNFNGASDLDEETLQAIAKLTDGRYFRATDSQSLQNIYKTINNLETTPQEQTSLRAQREYYPWPLALAILLLLYWFSKKAALFKGLRSEFERNPS